MIVNKDEEKFAFRLLMYSMLFIVVLLIIIPFILMGVISPMVLFFCWFLTWCFILLLFHNGGLIVLSGIALSILGFGLNCFVWYFNQENPILNSIVLFLIIIFACCFMYIIDYKVNEE